MRVGFDCETQSLRSLRIQQILDPIRNLYKDRSQGPDGPALYSILQQLEGLVRAVQGQPM